MSSTSHLVYRNFIWRVESISPISSIVTKKFLNTNFDRVAPDQLSGTTRNFSLVWNGASPALDVDDLVTRCATHDFELLVAYSTDIRRQTDFYDLLLQDRHDLLSTLRDDSLWRGYSDASPATDIGIASRVCAREEIVRGDVTWYLRQSWKCTIIETE